MRQFLCRLSREPSTLSSHSRTRLPTCEHKVSCAGSRAAIEERRHTISNRKLSIWSIDSSPGPPLPGYKTWPRKTGYRDVI